MLRALAIYASSPQAPNPFGNWLKGTNRPGKEEKYQNRFLVAPASVFITDSSPMYEFGGTSSATPVASAIASALWSKYSNSSAQEIGRALLKGASFERISPQRNMGDIESYEGSSIDFYKEYYGRGMIHYVNSEKFVKSDL